QFFLFGIEGGLGIKASLAGRIDSLEGVADLFHAVVDLDEDVLFETLQHEQDLFFVLLADLVITARGAIPERDGHRGPKRIIGTVPGGDAAEGIAELLARAGITVASEEVQLGK